MENINAFLFSWNPENFKIQELIPIINKVKTTGFATDQWGIGSFRKVKVGDRAFITKVHSNNNGIFASGKIIAKDFKFINWEKKSVPGVLIEFDTFLNPLEENILEINHIKSLISIPYNWSPRPSGMQIPEIITNKLEPLWDKFCIGNNVYSNVATNQIIEGRSFQLVQNVYERSPIARWECLKYYGHSCVVCGINFKNKYGSIGEGFIHVHHLNKLSNSNGECFTDPVKDLRPVCPNCHAMLHKRNPPYTIEELKEKLN